MTQRPAARRLLLALLLWLLALVWAWLQTTGPAPARDTTWRDLFTTQGWLQPMGVNTARGRTTLVNLQGLISVYFVNEKQGWAVGTGGTLLATVDGGQTWSPQSSGTNTPLESVHFISADRGWAVGSGGTILTTVDGGRTWGLQSSGTDERLNSVHFISAERGWAVGEKGTILTTVDGGRTWGPQSSGTDKWLYSVHFISAEQGWAVGWSGTILATVDGGRTWGPQSSGTDKSLKSVNFISAERGWAVGWIGTTLATVDGGRTWGPQNSGTFSLFTSVHFISAKRGWAMGFGGTLLVTVDGGRTWGLQSSGTDERLNSVHFISAERGWAVGWSGTILATVDGGRTWGPQSSGTSEQLNSVHFISAERGWAVGSGGTILASVDGGRTWSPQSSGTNTPLESVHFISAERGWAVGLRGTILATVDGGRTWGPQSSGTNESLYSVHFISAERGWAVGDRGTLLATVDGGRTWGPQSSGTSEQLNSVHVISAEQGWAVGSGGTILASVDGGRTWGPQSSGISERLISVHVISAEQGWAVSSRGTFLATVDGGRTWQNRSPAPESWRDLAWGGNPYQLWPSPLALLLCLGLLLVLVQGWGLFLRERRELAAAGGIHDAPVDDLASDRLQRAPLVRAMAQLFRNQNTRPPLAVALYAPWGVGKSSVLHMLKAELQGHARCVYINPWHYPQDSQLLAALMTGICTQAVPPMLSWANLKFRFMLLWQRLLRPHGCWAWVVLGVLVFVGWGGNPAHLALADAYRLHGTHVAPALQQTWANLLASLPPTLQAWAGAGAQAGLWLAALLLVYRAFLRSLHTFSPVLTQALKQSAQWATKSMRLPDWSQHAGLRHQFAEDFKDVASALGSGRLVLLIDDLDRCEPQQVARTLATLNFVFTSQAPCFVVLAMDRHYVQHALGLAYKNMAWAMNPQDAAGKNFARQYLRKLVQLEITLAHDRDQGAWMLLEPDMPESNASLSPSTSTSPDAAPAWGVQKWLQARGRYHRAAWQALLRKGGQTWAARPAGGVALRAAWRAAGQTVGAVWRWLGRGLGRAWAHLLDARPSRWEALGNALLAAVGSFALAGLITALALKVLPAWVPKDVPKPPAAAATTTPLVAPPITPPPLAPDRPERDAEKPKQSGQIAAVPPDSNQASLWWLLSNGLAVALFFLWVAFRVAQAVRDSEAFLQAVHHWRDVLSPRFPNPREWRRLSNAARFVAMRVRTDEQTLRSERWAAWWRAQLRWAQAVFSHVGPGPLPKPDSQDAPQKFRLSEGAAVELWMLSNMGQGDLRKALSQALNGTLDESQDLLNFFWTKTLIQEPDKASQLEELPNDQKKAVQVQVESGNSHMVEAYFSREELIQTSPNLQALFLAWRTDRQAVASELRRWLRWTEGLELDLSDSKPIDGTPP
jgi:photosystem II stability/assembly factor-like uncharacterized protein